MDKKKTKQKRMSMPVISMNPEKLTKRKMSSSDELTSKLDKLNRLSSDEEEQTKSPKGKLFQFGHIRQ